MADLSFIVGIIGNVISILVFASPIGTFRRIVKKKSTEDFKGVPYITTLLSTSLWTFYGLLKPGGLLVATVNGTGSLLQAIYVTLFLIYAPKKTKVWMAILIGVLNLGFLGVVIAVTLFAIHGSLRLLVVGLLCAALTVGMYASPMAAMRTVVKTKSVEYMPFFLSFFLFINGGVWSIYAVLVKDFFIGVPNAIGFVLGTAQLILYFIYRWKRSRNVEIKEEGGSAHLVSHVEMQKYWEKQKGTSEGVHRQVSKGSSHPKPSASTQNSIGKAKIVKSVSLPPYELYSNLHYDS